MVATFVRNKPIATALSKYPTEHNTRQTTWTFRFHFKQISKTFHFKTIPARTRLFSLRTPTLTPHTLHLIFLYHEVLNQTPIDVLR